MSDKTISPRALSELRTRYDAWLATSPPVTPPMRGLSNEGTLPLDEAGLAARGWSDLPIDWIPADGGVLHGGYGEDRAIYDTPIFNPPGDEPRTLHLGLDVFTAAGKPVFAPLDGQVHSLQLNDNEKDYGPTLILQHDVEPGLRFYTLYGHLDPSLLDTLQPGDQVERGQAIARLGDSSVNGGWAPHLHFQVMLDMLGKAGDFPGVCRKSEAAQWLQLCPDPRALIGLAS
ncbi:MAG: peptidoglycan DD-metalloendopeptidase family protein [Henriciella sp.]|nr:peptidoglycan DD-metalloendopeptidase family protein [Henriciella sp.]